MSANGLELVAIGPLTNIAAALIREPRLTSFLARINMMGGSLTFGNSTPAAEFNIRCDPEAAHLVFESGVPIRMAGLNLTNQAMVTAEVLDRIRGIGNKTSTIVADLWTYHCKQYSDLGILSGAPLHDPCAVAWLIDSDLVESCALHVAVELRGEHTRGMTVCDTRHLQGVGTDTWGVKGSYQGAPPNAEVGVRLDAPRFFDLVFSSLAGYP
jgi:inosine-uridine nucleoside N-ribohydrolase